MLLQVGEQCLVTLAGAQAAQQVDRADVQLDRHVPIDHRAPVAAEHAPEQTVVVDLLQALAQACGHALELRIVTPQATELEHRAQRIELARQGPAAPRAMRVPEAVAQLDEAVLAGIVQRQ